MTRLRTANLLAAFAGEILERVDLTLKSHPNQTDSAIAALNVIGFWDGITNAELAKALKLSHTATVRLVDKLEARGALRRGFSDRAVGRLLPRLCAGRGGQRALEAALRPVVPPSSGSAFQSVCASPAFCGHA